MKVSEAVEYVETLFNEKLSKVEGNIYEYRVQYLYVVERGETDYIYNILLEKIYKGIPLETSITYPMDDNVAESL
jgi:hypothetical protein